ncbi:phenylacetate--CoA ligase family protein [Mangrovimonas sp. TPBH4]|uniref:phenylacetate--CoA ligase family protein n=1 Tax=Mangrovimonas sp. TPBH4 TaxID=1645914 RepID=UPI0006B4B74F|nr:phenylacetate--CoA ligase family protein [Mangrovimonas sp. TPBH4]
MLELFRQKVFWCVDFIKGNHIKNQYTEVKGILKNLNSITSKEKQKVNLNAILQHAVATTPFYKDYKGYKTLSDFPVIDKNIIVNYYNDFKSSNYLDKENFSAYTSGSTGTPFKVYQNLHKKFRNTADVIYFAELTGFNVGDKLFYIRHWDQYNSKTPLEAWKRHIYMHPVSKLTNRDIEGLLGEIEKNNSSKGIVSYASALDEIRDYILKSGRKAPSDCGLKSIIAVGEKLNQETKEVIESYYNVEVVSRYSNVENGIIAQQLLGHKNGFYINWASYYVEILKLNSPEPVEKGELGRIVVTDLFNKCMPMIRYDTGDIGMMDYEKGHVDEYPVLMNIEGRKMDMIFDSKGNFISSYAVYNILKYPHIKQYQFIQESDKRYLFKLNVDKSFNSEGEIRKEFINLLGVDAEIEFEYVNEIPLLSSGKRKFVVNKSQKASKDRGMAAI